MRRFYAFEAEGVSEEVKTQLEKVEDVVEEKCESKADCEKILDKIDSEAEKFDGALKDMAGAAKDAQNGDSDAGEMNAKIAPAAAELKNIAKSIGVASEGDTLTEADLKDSKAYLEGAREIVEAKMDELEGGSDSGSSSESKSDEGSDSDSDEDSDEVTEEDATEAFLLDWALESYIDELNEACESTSFDLAMEGNNIDAISYINKLRTMMKEKKSKMKEWAKKGDYAMAAKFAREIATAGNNLVSAIDQMPDSVTSAVLVNLGLFIASMVLGASIGKAVDKVKSYDKTYNGPGKNTKVGQLFNSKMTKRQDDKQSGALKKMANAGYNSDETKARAKELLKADKAKYDAAAKNSKKSAAQLAQDDAWAEISQSQAKSMTKGGEMAAFRKAHPEMSLKDVQAHFDKQGGGDAMQNRVDFYKKEAQQLDKNAKNATIGRMAAGAGGAVTAFAAKSAGELAINKFLDKKNAKKSDGGVDTKKFGPNDVNPLLQAIKLDARLIAKVYGALANWYEKNAKVLGQNEKNVQKVSVVDGASYESAIPTDAIGGFIATCESMLIGGTGSRSNDVPYLFD